MHKNNPAIQGSLFKLPSLFLLKTSIADILMIVTNITPFINFAILSQCLFSIIYLSSHQWSTNKWLVIIFASVFSMQLGVFMSEDNLNFQQKIFMGNPGVILWVLPSLFLFTKELVSIESNRKGIFIHFLPGLVFYILFLFTEVNSARQFIASFSSGVFFPFQFFHFIALIIISTYYGYIILNLIKLNREKYKNEYAESSIYLTLDWLRYLVWIILGLSLSGVIMLIFFRFSNEVTIPFMWVEIIFLIIVMTASYFAFRQPTLYRPLQTDPLNKPNQIKTRDSKPLLSKSQITQLSIEIEKYFNQKQPFLNSKIRMPDIADALNITPNEFSWYLNEHLQINFFIFINQYRLEHATVLLKSPDYSHYTLEAISAMAGFRSKTTFNNRFKEFKNTTPSAFRKEKGLNTLCEK